MDSFRINGPTALAGAVTASGAKNAALPALAACLLTSKTVTLTNMPNVRDVVTMGRVLEQLGASLTREEVDADSRHLDPGSDPGSTLQPPRSPITHITAGELAGDRVAPYELVKTMRASVLVLGPLLARFGYARVSLPGGCAIGARPIDQHLAGLEAMGAVAELDQGYVAVRCPRRLQGAQFRLSVPSVGATENLLMAATLAEGTTVLDNCAREPEIVDLAKLLSAMGAQIEGAGASTIEIQGVQELGGATHPVMGDRIEAGTYLIGGVMTGGDVTVHGADEASLRPLLEKLRDCGAEIECEQQGIRAARGAVLESRDLLTAPHPGFPTDLQAQFLALMTQAEGTSTVVETVFENRFQHVPELVRMGAAVQVDGRNATVEGPATLSGTTVMATDLRASACLVLAGLCARGTTMVDRIYHLDRGYERMESKLQSLGAQVERVGGRGV